MGHGNKRDENPPFFVSLSINGLCLNNCMIDSSDLENVMPLKDMKQLGLKVTRPYKNVCGIESKIIKVYGLIIDLEVYLVAYPDVNIKMDVIVMNVPYAWEIILYRK
jgi:hypothetical protein